jgi:hypothetical protein
MHSSLRSVTTSPPRRKLASSPTLRDMNLRHLLLGLLLFSRAFAAPIWIEGENPIVNKMNRHPWWYDKVHREHLSGGDFISNFSKEKPGEAEYRFDAPAAGEYEFWLHANPVKSRLTYALNGAPPVAVDFSGEKLDQQNIAADDKPDLRPLINHTAKTVTSSTGKLALDYGKGVLVINAPCAQGVSGNLKAAGSVRTKDLAITSDLETGHIIAVALDDQPLATSGKILLQVMSEEKASGFQTAPVSTSVKRIVNIGRDPWLVKHLTGTVHFNRALKATPLDANGHPTGDSVATQPLQLRPTTLYYLLTP